MRPGEWRERGACPRRRRPAFEGRTCEAPGLLFAFLALLALAASGVEAQEGRLVPKRPGVEGRPLPESDVCARACGAGRGGGAQARGGCFRLPQETMRRVGELVRQSRRAAVGRGGGGAPQGRMRRIVIEPGAGGPVPVIEVRHRWTTVLSFRDATGSPWPVEDVFVDKAFTGGSEAPPAESNLVYLVPQRRYLEGNLVVKLEDLPEPVMAVLRDPWRRDDGLGGGRRLLTRPGPNVDAAALVRPAQLNAGDEMLFGLLGGRIPKGAIRVELTGGGAGDRAWAARGGPAAHHAAYRIEPGPVGGGARVRRALGVPVAFDAAAPRESRRGRKGGSGSAKGNPRCGARPRLVGQ